MLNRRDFLKINGLLALVPFFSKADGADEDKVYKVPKGQLRVWQGATDSQATIISVFASRESYLFFQVSYGNKFSQHIEVNKIDLKYGEYILYQVTISQLELGNEYTLSIYDKTFNKSYYRKFSALDLSSKNSKIALLSCANYKKADPQQGMCKRLVSTNPDVIFFLGDLVYANSAFNTLLGTSANPEEAYLAYTRTILEIDLYNFEKLIPIFGIHDDHDLGKNNSDSHVQNKDIMLKMFRSFFPVDNRVLEVKQGPGNSFAMVSFGMISVFFDTRSFKDKKQNVYLGTQQLAWLKQILAENKLPVMLISTQQFWSYRMLAESYEDTSESEFLDLIKYISNIKQNVFFVSGDVHYSQLQQLEYDKVQAKTYEITSSAFFSSSARSFGRRSVEDGQLFYHGHPNFLTLQNFRFENDLLAMRVCCHTSEAENLFTEDIEIFRKK